MSLDKGFVGVLYPGLEGVCRALTLRLLFWSILP